MEDKKKYKRKRTHNKLKERNIFINNFKNIDFFIKIDKLQKINYYNFINDELKNNGPKVTKKRFI